MKSRPSPAWISIAAIVLLWQLAADRIQHPALFPSVLQLIKEIAVLAGSLPFYQSIFLTILRGFEAFLLATLIALPASVIALHSSFWKSFFHPLVVILRSIPVIAVVLIALLLLTPTNLPIIIGCITMLPILYQNFLSAWENTDPKLVEMARFYRKSLLQRFRYVYFLQSKELLFAGLATAIGFGWRAIIIGEVLSSPSMGIGALMKKSQAYIDMPGLLSWTLVAITWGFVAEKVISLVATQPYTIRINQKTKSSSIQLAKAIRKVSITNLNYITETSQVFKQFNLQLDNSKLSILSTPSGTGKTTLLLILADLLKKNSGKIDLSKILSCSYSFQDKRLISGMTTFQNIAFVLPDFPSISKTEAERIEMLINKFELTAYHSSPVSTLSGGEQQRVALARALIMQSDLILLDEPLTGIDHALKSKIIEFMEQEFMEYNPLVIWATHEPLKTKQLEQLIITKFE